MNEEMKALPTRYRGHDYPSILGAKIPFFLDEAGLEYEIEPRNPENGGRYFDVGIDKKLFYAPDLLVHGAWVLFSDGDMRFLDELYLEPKGVWKDDVVAKAEGFCALYHKNILFIDDTIWPIRSQKKDWYDSSWPNGTDETIEMETYGRMADSIRQTKEWKRGRPNNDGVLQGRWGQFQFSLFTTRKCDMCRSDCRNVEIFKYSAHKREDFCIAPRWEVFSDMGLCVGAAQGEVVVCQLTPSGSDGELRRKAEIFADVCDVEKTRAAHFAACKAYRDEHGELCPFA